MHATNPPGCSIRQCRFVALGGLTLIASKCSSHLGAREWGEESPLRLGLTTLFFDLLYGVKLLATA